MSRGVVVAAAVGGLVARRCWQRRALVPGGAQRWARTNHRGEPVTLLEGPAWAAGALAGALVAPGMHPVTRAGAVLATVGAGAFGAVDDLAETGGEKGLRGHLGALARGELTTGGLKVLGIGATSVAAAALLLRRGRRSVVDTVLAGGVVAGSANLANLLDLRPGRVLKVVGLLAPLLLRHRQAGPLAAAALGAGAALLGPDLDERSMLGDCGANAAGALLGSSLVAATATHGRAGRRLRAAALAALVALTVASERVSFTSVIEATPGLRELDAWGRRPSASPPASPPAPAPAPA